MPSHTAAERRKKRVRKTGESQTSFEIRTKTPSKKTGTKITTKKKKTKKRK